MKIGVVDIGTNSVRLMIGNYKGGKLQSKEKQLYSTRIGQGVDHTGELSEAAMDRTVKALESIRVQMEQLGAQKVYVYATSAVRQAKNKEVFLDRVKEKTGYEIKVLSGEEEAEYGFLGVMKSVALENGLIVDVGGGSTELIEVQNRQRKRLVSLDIGAVRLYERCKASDPMRKEEIRCVQAEIERALRKWDRETEAKNLVAIGGTATTIASMHLRLKEYDSQKINGCQIGRSDIATMCEKLEKQTVEERKKEIGLAPKRADIIVCGILIYKELMERDGYETMTVSDGDNLEGALEINKRNS